MRNANMPNLTPFEQSYIETALWSSTDDSDNPLDSSEYSDTEFTPSAIEKIQADCRKFQETAKPLLDAFERETDASVLNSCNLTPNRIAHDFWLTRNRHGAGFWDGDYPEPLATQLTSLAHSFSECDVYIGDDKQFYLA